MARRLFGSCMRRAISGEPFGMNDLRCSVAMVRKIHAAFAEKNLYMLDSPVSGGPSGATGRVRTFDRLGQRFLTGQHDPADFALRLLHKDVGLAVGLGREVGVPMRLANLAFE